MASLAFSSSSLTCFLSHSESPSLLRRPTKLSSFKTLASISTTRTESAPRFLALKLKPLRRRCPTIATPPLLSLPHARLVLAFFSNSRDKSDGGNFSREGSGGDCQILQRWDVPWQWQTISFTALACGFSFVLAGSVEVAAISYLGLDLGELNLDEKAAILLLDQGITTAVVLGVLYSLINNQPVPPDFFRYDRCSSSIATVDWIVKCQHCMPGGYHWGPCTTPRRDCVPWLLDGLLDQVKYATSPTEGLEGHASCQRFPTPVSVLISSAAFAVSHLTPGEFPQLFVLGMALGFSYAQTRNLLTPITIHALWNSGVILLLTFLELQGYDIRELIQAS